MISYLRLGRRSVATGLAVTALLARRRAQPCTSYLERAQASSRTAQRISSIHHVCTHITGAMPPTPSVLVANHLSYIDPVLIAGAAPCIAISKGEVAKWPLIGSAMASMGVLFVNRDEPMSRIMTLRRALRVLEAGACVLNFPEGTTSDGSRLLPFKRGIFGLARLAGVPVVPVVIQYELPAMHWIGDETFLPHYARTARRRTSVARVHFGAPITTTCRTAEELLAAARHEMLAILERPINEPAERVRLSPPWADTVLPPAAGRPQHAQPRPLSRYQSGNAGRPI